VHGVRESGYAEVSAATQYRAAHGRRITQTNLANDATSCARAFNSNAMLMMVIGFLLDLVGLDWPDMDGGKRVSMFNGKGPQPLRGVKLHEAQEASSLGR
jgi:hypothetical protein